MSNIVTHSQSPNEVTEGGQNNVDFRMFATNAEWIVRKRISSHELLFCFVRGDDVLEKT